MKRVLFCAVLMAWSGLASAVVYKWVNAQGKVEYGDRPPDGVHAEVVEGLGTHPERGKSEAAPAAAKTAAPVPAARDAKKTVQEDVAQARQKQCADAQERYKKLIEGRHIYKTGDNGERQYLTSEEIDSERLNAKHEVDETCGNSPT
ncbi:MAG: DUF4124 domain-containing protein [Steroidobacteraceae bacterium]